MSELIRRCCAPRQRDKLPQLYSVLPQLESVDHFQDGRQHSQRADVPATCMSVVSKKGRQTKKMLTAFMGIGIFDIS